MPLGKISAVVFLFFFPGIPDLTFHANCLFWIFQLETAFMTYISLSWTSSHFSGKLSTPKKEKKCSHWEQFDPFRVDLFSKGVWCTGKQMGSHKSYLPCQKWRKYTIDFMLKFMYVIRCTHGALIFSMNKSLFYFALSTKCNKPHITKTRLFKYMKNFTFKNWNFSDKKLW